MSIVTPKVGSPLISIVIPTYNRPVEVCKAIHAIQHQDFTDWEIVVVNNGCTDHTQVLLESMVADDPRIRIEVMERTRATAARNHGILSTNAASTYVMLHDDDDWLFPGALTMLLRRAAERPDAVLVYGMPLNCDDNGYSTDTLETAYASKRLSISDKGFPHWLPLTADDSFGNLAIWSPIATFGQVLIRRTALDTNGLLLDNFGIADDWDFWIRLSLLGPFARVNEFVLYRRYIATNVSKNHALLLPSVLSIRHSLKYSRGLSRKQRRVSTMANATSSYLFLLWAQTAFKQHRIKDACSLIVSAVKETVKSQILWARLDRNRECVERHAGRDTGSDTGFVIQ